MNDPKGVRVLTMAELGLPLVPRRRKDWSHVNKVIKGLKPGQVAEFEYPQPEGETEEEIQKQRKELRMVVTVACRRFLGVGKYHVVTSPDGKLLMAYLKEG